MSLSMSLRSRGPAASASRTATVISRFGATSSAMARRLERYDAITASLGARPTWPTTACVLARHPDLMRKYADRGAELAVHGLVHGDHAAMSRRLQRDTIARAVEIFDRAGLRPNGFRGPYLRYNEATLDVLRELGFLYHSSQAVAFPPRSAEAWPAQPSVSYERALELYSALDARRHAVRPRVRDGLIDIPVAVPDDEMLLERMRLSETDRTAVWLHVLGFTHDRGDLFTLQLHPERVAELAGALDAVIREARRLRPVVFVGRLDEIAEWWSRRSRFAIDVTNDAGGGWRVQISAEQDATVLVRGLDVAAESWLGRDEVTALRGFVSRSARKPIVGVSRRSPAAVHRFVAEEGLPYEVSDDRDRFGAYVDVGENWDESDALEVIESAPGPLVRIWRWPNGARSALAVTGDVDALTLRDFLVRSWETRATAARDSEVR